MKLKIIAAIALLAVTPSLFATDWSHTYTQNQAITITIETAYNYTISIVRQAGGYTQTFPVVTGKGTTQSFTVGPGTITLHVKYSDGGAFKDPAFFNCPGPSVKFSFTSHGTNCADYTDATVLVQPGN